jgi:hypothetical protein
MVVLTATLVVLATVLVVAALLLVVAAVQSRTRRQAPGVPAARPGPGRGSPGLGGPAPGGPALGSPAQVWLERGEKVAQRVRALSAGNPALTGVGDDADEVLAELRNAAADVAALDAARGRSPVSTLQAERERLDRAMEQAAGQPAEADLRAARDAVAARLALAAQQRATGDALLARMHAAVAGLERAEDELSGLLAAPSPAVTTAVVELGDRLAGLRAGLAEVRAISARATPPSAGPGQGFPGDLPGSVEPPRRT